MPAASPGIVSDIIANRHYPSDEAYLFALADVLKEVHKFAALSMAALVLLHVAGAVKHQIIDRDGLMSRMGIR